MTPEEEIAIAKLSDQDMEKCQRAYDLVCTYFNDDVKAVIWFEHPNAKLGNTPPKQLMINGNIDRLLTYIESYTKEHWQ